jgi:hypothetical protein
MVEVTVKLTAAELDALALCNPAGWPRTPGLTSRERAAVESAMRKLKIANIEAATRLCSGRE